VDGLQILEIRADGIEYVDDEGKRKFIEFAACHENYVERVTSRDYWEQLKVSSKKTDDDFQGHVDRANNWKEVGARQILGPPWDDGPYIEFHTKPPVRFYLTEQQYGQVVGKIHKLGWKTFDRS
jgi:hypothetical protein